MTYHPQLITHEYDFSPMTVRHDYHPWPSWLMTIIYDLSHLWLSGLLPMTITYHLSPMTITYNYDLWLSLVTLRLITNDNASHPWPITCHSWLCLLILTYDLWPSLMTYDLWPMAYDYDLWPSSITSNYHLSPITVTHDLSIAMTYHMSLMTYS